MLDLRHLWKLATCCPRAFAGARLHRWGLEAVHRADHAMAERLFEAAAARYRQDLAVEPLARLRAHQSIARIRALGCQEAPGDLLIDVEHRLARLDRIESLVPPFAMVRASTLLASWLARDPVELEALEPLRQAA